MLAAAIFVATLTVGLMMIAWYGRAKDVDIDNSVVAIVTGNLWALAFFILLMEKL